MPHSDITPSAGYMYTTIACHVYIKRKRNIIYETDRKSYYLTIDAKLFSLTGWESIH